MSAATNTATTPPDYDLLIIGAGIAGLAAGRMAQRAGYSVMLIDKGRRVGGRVSTRRSDGFMFNHGAQYITARTDEFTAALTAATSAGMAGNWQIDPAKNVVIGAPMMRAIPGFLADGLPIQQNRRIARISRQADHIACIDIEGDALRAVQVICTAPAPQTATLLASDFPALAATAASATYAPCVTIMLGLADDSHLPATPLHAPQHDIGWAMRETARPHAASMRPALTIQASAEWSAAHINDTDDTSIAQLIDKYQLASGCPVGDVLHAQAHRWLYAKVTTAAAPDALIYQDNLAIAGDCLGGARVEHAFTSGIHAVEALTKAASSHQGQPAKSYLIN